MLSLKSARPNTSSETFLIFFQFDFKYVDNWALLFKGNEPPYMIKACLKIQNSPRQVRSYM